jgi:hypothetical protein
VARFTSELSADLALKEIKRIWGYRLIVRKRTGHQAFFLFISIAVGFLNLPARSQAEAQLGSTVTTTTVKENKSVRSTTTTDPDDPPESAGKAKCVRGTKAESTTTTIVPGIPCEYPEFYTYIPDEPSYQNARCGTLQFKKLIMAKDGLNYQCQIFGATLTWQPYDCNFGKSIPTCLTLPPNAIQPEIQDRWENYAGFSPYGSVVGFYLKTSTGANTRYILEIAIDSDFKQVVYLYDADVFFDPGWRCDIMWCSMGMDITKNGPFSTLYGVSKVTGSFYARATVKNSTGIARRNFGLQSLPGSQMVLDAKTQTAVTLPVSNATTSTSTPMTVTATTMPKANTSKIKVVLTCIKGRLSKSVSGSNPKCPKGWKSK